MSVPGQERVRQRRDNVPVACFSMESVTPANLPIFEDSKQLSINECVVTGERSLHLISHGDPCEPLSIEYSPVSVSNWIVEETRPKCGLAQLDRVSATRVWMRFDWLRRGGLQTRYPGRRQEAAMVES